jgi:hypothetical protein
MEQNVPKKPGYRCTRGQFEDFKSSLLWQDMLQEVELWISNAHHNLEDPSLSDIETAVIRGCIRSARDLMQLPDTIINILTMEAEYDSDGDVEKTEES